MCSTEITDRHLQFLDASLQKTDVLLQVLEIAVIGNKDVYFL